MEEKRSSIKRSTVRVVLLWAAVAVIVAVTVISYVLASGGDRPLSEMDNSAVGTDLWSKTLGYAHWAENRATPRVDDNLINLSNAAVTVELDKKDPYLSKVYGSESGRVLFLSLPTLKMYGAERELRLSDATWTVPVNGSYSASALFTSSLTGEGKEEEFKALVSYEIDDKDTLSQWSNINGGCKIALDDSVAKVTVSGETSPYFGAGELDIDLTLIPENAVGCVRLKMRGSGVREVEINYSAVYDTVRLQGVSDEDLALGEEWTYITVPVTDGNFVGTLYTLYFRFTTDAEASFELASVEVGYIDTYKAPVSVESVSTAYADRYIISSTVTALESFVPQRAWTESIILPGELNYIEVVSGGASSYHKPENATLNGVEYAVFHFASGEAVMVMPLSPLFTGEVEVSVSDSGYVTVKNYLDVSSLEVAEGKVEVSFRTEYASAEVLQDFSDTYNEEVRLLTSEDVSVSGGSFEGYDPLTGRYVFACDGTGGLSFTMVSKDDRYVYVEFKNADGHTALRNSSGEKLPINLTGADPVAGLYLRAGESMSLTLTSVEDVGRAEAFLDGIGYRNSSGKDVEAVFTSAEYVVRSEICSEVKYVGVTEDGAANVTLTLVTYRDGDDPVYCYDLDFSFTRNVTLSSLTENLRLFSFDKTGKTDLIFTDVAGEISYRSASDMKTDSTFTLATRSPAVAIRTDDGYTAGAVIDLYSATANITPLSSLLHAGYDGDSIYVSGTGDLTHGDDAAFGLGDHIKLRCFVSASSTETPEELISRLRSAYGNGYITVTERGSVSDAVIPTVTLSPSGVAVFNVRGGTSTLPVRVEGVDGYLLPKITVDGKPYVPAGYTPYMTDEGKVGFVFCVPCGARVEVEE